MCYLCVKYIVTCDNFALTYFEELIALTKYHNRAPLSKYEREMISVLFELFLKGYLLDVYDNFCSKKLHKYTVSAMINYFLIKYKKKVFYAILSFNILT